MNVEVNTNLLPSNCAIPNFLLLHVSTTNCSHLRGATVPEDTCSVLQLDSFENNSLSRRLDVTFRVFSMLEMRHDSATHSASLFASI